MVSNIRPSLPQDTKLGIASTYKQKFESYGKIYFLFHKKKIANQLLSQLKQISAREITCSAQSKTIVEASQWFLKHVLRSNIHIPRFWINSEKNKVIAKLALKLEAPNGLTILHIHGENDGIFPAQKICPNVLIPNAGHFMYVEHEKELLKNILTFL